MKLAFHTTPIPKDIGCCVKVCVKKKTEYNDLQIS